MKGRGIDLAWVNPKDLADGKNPRNWKTHPDRQKKAVKAIIKRNGWARPLLWNTRTKRLIDGHGRLEIALEEGWKEVPVIKGDWSEAQEKELLASLDTTSDMAQIDAHALDSLTKEIAKSVEEIVGKDDAADEILKASIDINAFAHTIEPRSPVIRRRGARRKIGNEKIKVPTVRKQRKEPYREVLEQRTEEDSILFTSTNKWGFPDLQPRHCYTDIKTLPTGTWNGNEADHHALNWMSWSMAPFHGKEEGGFLNFYTDDYRFNRIYKLSNLYVEKFIAWDFLAICEPDFSTYDVWPLAARLWNLFKSRWTARFLAEKCKAKIIPLIRRSSNPERDHWLYDTLPDVPVMSVNCGQSHIGKKDGRESRIKKSIEAAMKGRNIKVILLNSGKEHQKYLEGWLPTGPKYVFLESSATARRKYLDALSLKRKGR